MKIFNFLHKTKSRENTPSEFSRFFREASSAEKKRVFLDVAKKASADQKAVIDSAHRSAIHAQ